MWSFSTSAAAIGIEIELSMTAMGSSGVRSENWATTDEVSGTVSIEHDSGWYSLSHLT